MFFYCSYCCFPRSLLVVDLFLLFLLYVSVACEFDIYNCPYLIDHVLLYTQYSTFKTCRCRIVTYSLSHTHHITLSPCPVKSRHSVQFVTALMSSSHRSRGLPLFLVPPPILNIINFSKLFSFRMIKLCPKHDSCCFFINASSGLVALIASITDVLVLLAVQGIRNSLLQHHNSKLSIILP